MTEPTAVRAAAIGLNHPHVFQMAHAVVAAGAEMVAWHHPEESAMANVFAKAHPAAKQAAQAREVLEDESVDLVLCAAINADRAEISRLAMQHGKDVLSDKPGVTTRAQLATLQRVQQETGRIYSVFFSERVQNPATVRASELVMGGAIGRVIQTIGLGPHRLSPQTRPAWFFLQQRSGGILCDIASHQMDQFLHFTGTESASVAMARTENYAHPEHPEFEDFGEVLLTGTECSGYARVDWFTPDGLATWGDARLTILGTEGFIEIRKNIDLAGQPGANHLFLVDAKETRHIACDDVPLPFAHQLLADIRDRTETAMPQAHCFRACALSVEAQARAQARHIDANAHAKEHA